MKLVAGRVTYLMRRRPVAAHNILGSRASVGMSDVTVVNTLAEPYVAIAARGRGELAELAAVRKC